MAFDVQQRQQQRQPFKNLLFQLSNHLIASAVGQQQQQWTVRASVSGQDLMVASTFQVVAVVPQSIENDVVVAPGSVTQLPFDSSVMMVESHFVELDFSPRTASMIQPNCPFAGEVSQFFFSFKKGFKKKHFKVSFLF